MGRQHHDREDGILFDPQLASQERGRSPFAIQSREAPASPAAPMNNPKLQLKRAKEYGFTFADIPLYSSTADAPIQRDAQEEEDVAQPKLENGVQRDEDEDETTQLKEDVLQRDGDDAVNLVPKGPGNPMPADMQNEFSSAGMPNAAKARWHVDDQATKSVSALAYTTGNDIVVQDKIKNNPAQLKKTFAHEGTHVEEQATMNIRPDVPGTPINASHEANAEANEARFAQGKPLAMDGAAAQRKDEPD